MVTMDLGQFGKRMADVAAEVPPRCDKVVRTFSIVANQTIVMATPVDKGFARANWQVSIGVPITTETDSTDAQGAISRNAAVIGGYTSGGGDLLIQNNRSYIKRLNEGWSAQAPANFVQKALRASARAISKTQVVKP
jgi:hypothetical protein